MKTYIYLILKYWKKHIKNALAMLFSGILLSAIIFVALMFAREESARTLHNLFDSDGYFQILITNSDDDILAKVTEGKSGYNYGAMYVYGKLGTSEKQFAYGTIEDEHNIWHIPLKEGRMPETADEIAADRGALNSLFWAGKCGDTITLDGKTYTVVGIIDEKYGKKRCGSELKEHPYERVESSTYKVPLIFVGKCDGKPLYRIDMLNNFIDLDQSKESFDREYDKYDELLDEIVGYEYETRWFNITSEWEIPFFNISSHSARFFLVIARLGAIVSALSVYSVLKNIFTERKSRIDILKRIGMSKRSIAIMYAVECAGFTAIQIIFGIALGLAAYEGIFAFRTNVLGEKVYSGFTDIWHVKRETFDPFLFSIIIPAVIIVSAYILCAITDKLRYNMPNKNAEPRPLSKCFSSAFGARAITITQTAALTLICFSVLMGYMFYTDNGKSATTDYVIYIPPSNSYTANGLKMEDNNIAEYYSCSAPQTSSIGDPKTSLLFINADYTAGIDDNTADTLPEYAMPSGNLTQTFIASKEQNFRYINEIDTSSKDFRQGLLAISSAEHQNFFDEGQLGSMHLYRIDTKLAPARTISSLSGNIVEGELNIDKLNSGEEIIVVYKGAKPSFEIGETVLLNSIAATETGFGIGDIASAEVKIGAFLKMTEKDDKVTNAVARNKEDYNFLTTATGAENMGLHCAKYTDIYTSEPMNGGLIPSSAQMTMISLQMMKHDYLINQLVKYSSSILILIVMSLLGFAAYFNGIGMKIRLKKYEISVLRAVGMNAKDLRKKLLLSNLKIPLISSAAAYVIAKLTQLEMWLFYEFMSNAYDHAFQGEAVFTNIKFINDIMFYMISYSKQNLFIDSLMWQANAEIPALIMLIILCAVTFLLTIIALKKFKSNIAGDLSEGRTRQ